MVGGQCHGVDFGCAVRLGRVPHGHTQISMVDAARSV